MLRKKEGEEGDSLCVLAEGVDDEARVLQLSILTRTRSLVCKSNDFNSSRFRSQEGRKDGRKERKEGEGKATHADSNSRMICRRRTAWTSVTPLLTAAMRSTLEKDLKNWESCLTAPSA